MWIRVLIVPLCQPLTLRCELSTFLSRHLSHSSSRSLTPRLVCSAGSSAVLALRRVFLPSSTHTRACFLVHT